MKNDKKETHFFVFQNNFPINRAGKGVTFETIEQAQTFFDAMPEHTQNASHIAERRKSL